MTTWRAVLLDQIEDGVRSRFGAAVVMVRDVDGEGTMRLSVSWREGGGSYVQLRADAAYAVDLAREAIEVVTDGLWRHAPIAGSC